MRENQPSLFDEPRKLSCAIYARVSSTSDRQSTDRQVIELQRLAAQRGLDVVRVFTEKASGAKADRPVLHECLEYCCANRVSSLLVSELSRLGRSLKVIVDSLDALTKASVNVHIADLNLDTLDDSGRQNPFGALLLAVMGACAEIERRNIYERLCSGKAAKRTTEGKKTKSERARQSSEQLLEKHADVVKLLQSGRTVADAAARTGKSPTTVQKVRNAIYTADTLELSPATLQRKGLLSAKTAAALQRQRVLDITNLAGYSKKQLLEIPGLGAKGMEEVIRAFKSEGICLPIG